MRDRYKILDEKGVHFITSTITEWIPIFTQRAYFDIIIDALKFCMKNKGLQLYAYTIVDNHFHLVVSSRELSATMASLRKYTAHKIIAQLELDQKDWILNQLSYYKKRHKNQSQYQIWQEGTHPELITDTNMLFQKIEYIHFNPVKRGYVDSPEHWRYSSARNYLYDDHSVIEVDCSLR